MIPSSASDTTAMKRLTKRPLTIREILGWAELHRQRTGKWPTKESGPIPESGARHETWAVVDNALRVGVRDLPGGSSLARLLAEKKGVRNIRALPPLSVEQILGWADDFRAQTGTWPTKKSGVIPDTDGETWTYIDGALQQGQRGLPGGSSLPRLLAEHRGVRNRKQLPSYTEDQILRWADAHPERTGDWPTAKSGPIADAPGETWTAVQVALRQGRRGLPGGSSLALLLGDKRGVRNFWTRPLLSVEQILRWADAFHARTSEWPRIESGPIQESPGDTWLAVNHALSRSTRGLPGGTSLVKLLNAERGVRTSAPPLTRKQILAWADAHFKKTGKWPTMESGTVLDAPDETWAAVDAALKVGSRGLHGGSSLAWLLVKYRGKRSRIDQPPLSQKKILAWADAHFQRTGKWPNVNSGEVVDAPGEKWKLIDSDLRAGQRGLPGGSSLAKLLAKKRGLRNPTDLPPLTEAEILRLADLHFQRTGKYPFYNDGPVADAPGETWTAFDMALRNGRRGLPGGSSLAKLLSAAGRKKHRRHGY